MKSGFAIIIGRSNVGKSTLINALVGSKIAITTNKPQTTRMIIHGIVTDERGQVVFVDTPGILKGSHSELTGQLVEKVKDALKGIDVIVYVVDPTRAVGAEERYTLSLVRAATIPKILVINKIDVAKKPFLEDYRALGASDFTETIEISAFAGTHTQGLLNKVFDALPEGEAMYPENQRTNLSKEQWIAEIIREKALNEMRQELPYAMHVVVDSVKEKIAPNGNEFMYVIEARIVTAADRYKKMIIGAGGRTIKEIGTVARRDLEERLNTKVFLDLEVETNAHWADLI